METLPALSHEVWKRTPPEAQASMRALEVRVATLEGMMQALQEQRNQTLAALLTPSIKRPAPPRERPPHPRSPRRRGGQPGHPGSTRTLIPVEEADEVVVIKPEQCPHCQAPLSGDDSTPWRHQVIEIPRFKPVVTEYQWHQLAGPAAVRPRAHPGLQASPAGTYGPRVQATVALW